MRKWVNVTLLSVVCVFAAMQLIRPAHTNPPEEPQRTLQAFHQSDPAATQLLNRACNDCHSHRTQWPWYSHVAPVSWLVTSDVNRGRHAMNLSEWAIYTPKQQAEILHDVCEEVSQGEMPQMTYTLMHPAARLSSADRQVLCAWTRAALGNAPSDEKED